MSDKPRDWPTVAKHARDCTAELALSGAKQLEPLFIDERIFTESERSARERRAYAALMKILSNMQSVGAEIRPDFSE